MKKNVSRKSKTTAKRSKSKVQKAASKSTIKKTKKRTDSSKLKNVGRFKTAKPPKEDLTLIRYTGYNVTKTNKVRLNDEKGRLIWVDASDFKKVYSRLNNAKIKREQKREREQVKKENVKFRKQINSEEKINTKINSSEKLKRYLKNNKIKFKGNVANKAAEKEILKFAEILDKKKIKWNLQEMMEKTKGIKKRILKISDKDSGTPQYKFYWNIQNTIEYNKNKKIPKTKIIDFNGNEIYNGNDKAKIAEILNDLNKQLEEIEEGFKEEETNPYFTVATFETTLNDELIELEINYASIESRLPRAEHRDILNKLKAR